MPIAACTLRRCQGRRGCICPTGLMPVGTYSGSHSKKESKEIRLPPVTHKTISSSGSLFEQNNLKKVANSTTRNLLTNSAAEKKPDEIKINNDVTSINNSSIIPVNATDVSKVNEDDKILTKNTNNNSNDGFVTVKYNHYSKKFPIVNGSTTASAIDEEYSLSFAFPNSKIHLTTRSPIMTTSEDTIVTTPLIEENPVGTFQGLQVNDSYWVYVEEDVEDRKQYEERQEKFAREQAKKREEDEKALENGNLTIKKEKIESCSCVEGNPCLDRYSCKDWNNRYVIAKKCGWKGF